MLKKELQKLPVRHARRRTALSRALARAGRFYWQSYETPGYGLRSNGESMLQERVAAMGGRRFFDVGANVGKWTSAALTADADVFVHAFEIAGPTFERLQGELGNDSRVKLNDFGLYDADSEVQLDYFPERDAVTTAVRGMDIHAGKHAKTIQAKVMTGDRYCNENGVERIDLLKIDTEGSEPNVLRGFSGMLDSGRIDVIQFEYGLMNIYTRFLLIDFYELLGGYGFNIGKLYRQGVRFKEYEPRDEDFLGPNYVAVHESCSDLHRELGMDPGW